MKTILGAQETKTYKMDVHERDEDYVVAEIFKEGKRIYQAVRSGSPQRAINAALAGANISRDEVEIVYGLE